MRLFNNLLSSSSWTNHFDPSHCCPIQGLRHNSVIFSTLHGSVTLGTIRGLLILGYRQTWFPLTSSIGTRSQKKFLTSVGSQGSRCLLALILSRNNLTPTSSSIPFKR